MLYVFKVHINVGDTKVEVQRAENFGYTLFFVGNDNRLPFVTLANSDNDYDKVSDLDRKEVLRI